MSEQKPDWDAIQAEYETGIGSYREIAAKYGVKATTLYDRSRKWVRTPNTEHRTPNKNNPNTEHGEEPQNISSLHLVRPELPSPPTAIEGANLGLEALVTFLKDNKATMNLADHVKASNALSQYNKIIINAPPEEQDAEHEDLSLFNEDELKLYAELQERAKRA